MANITKQLEFIKTAKYGRDVRQSIYEAIEAVNSGAEGSAAAAERSKTAPKLRKQERKVPRRQQKGQRQPLKPRKQERKVLRRRQKGQRQPPKPHKLNHKKTQKCPRVGQEEVAEKSEKGTKLTTANFTADNHITAQNCPKIITKRQNKQGTMQ